MTAARRALIPPTGGNALERAAAWSTLPADERRRRAVAAGQEHDAVGLWSLTAAYLTASGRTGATVSVHTRAAYRRGRGAVRPVWTQENLLHPSRNAGTHWLRHREDAGARDRQGLPKRAKEGRPVGLAPASVRVYRAAARTLDAALRWAGATDAEPFTDARPAPDMTAPWDKRAPYSPEEVQALRARAGPLGRALLLLAGPAGLRIAAVMDLRWDNVDLAGRALVVRRGKGGKRRRVVLSASTVAALGHLR